jgi:2'-5' RNA ligase
MECLFIGLPVPNRLVGPIELSFSKYPQYIEQVIPPETWHLTLLYLGEVKNSRQYYGRLRVPLPQPFVPTVRITHVGRGLNKHQLWAYAEPSPVLTNLRHEILQRIKGMRLQHAAEIKIDDFVPHIAIAKLFPVAGGVGMADFPINVSFPVDQVTLYQNHSDEEARRYTRLEEIDLRP